MYVCLVAFVGAICGEMGCDERRQMRRSIDFLLQVTTPTARLRCIRVLVSPYRTPHRWNLHRENTRISKEDGGKRSAAKPATKAVGLERDRRGNGKRQKGRGGGAKRRERGTDQVICCCFAVSYETCARFAHTYTWTSEVLAQTLVVLEEASKFQL